MLLMLLFLLVSFSICGEDLQRAIEECLAQKEVKRPKLLDYKKGKLGYAQEVKRIVQELPYEKLEKLNEYLIQKRQDYILSHPDNWFDYIYKNFESVKLFYNTLQKLDNDLKPVKNLKIDKSRIKNFLSIFKAFSNPSFEYLKRTVEFIVLRDHVNAFYDSLHELEQRMLPEKDDLLRLVLRLSDLRKRMRLDLEKGIGLELSEEPLFVESEEIDVKPKPSPLLLKEKVGYGAEAERILDSKVLESMSHAQLKQLSDSIEKVKKEVERYKVIERALESREAWMELLESFDSFSNYAASLNNLIDKLKPYKNYFQNLKPVFVMSSSSLAKNLTKNDLESLLNQSFERLNADAISYDLDKESILQDASNLILYRNALRKDLSELGLNLKDESLIKLG